MRMKQRDERRLQLGRIHQAQKALGLDDDTYRALLQRVTGKTSSAQMSPEERNAVLREFARLGFKKAEAGDRARTFPGRPKDVRTRPMLRKVEALLADDKRAWSYAHSLAKRMFHVTRVEWLNDNDLHKLVSVLQVDANRRKAKGGDPCTE